MVTKWPVRYYPAKALKARPAPPPPHGATYSYDTYPDGKKIPLAKSHAWVEYETKPYFDDRLNLRNTVYLNTYQPGHPPTDRESESYHRWRHNRARINATLDAYNHESDPAARARYLKRNLISERRIVRHKGPLPDTPSANKTKTTIVPSGTGFECKPPCGWCGTNKCKSYKEWESTRRLSSPKLPAQKARNGPGSGWHGESRRHSIAARKGHRRR